jgi:site-specific DNA-methyltransferase (adenine-specific)
MTKHTIYVGNCLDVLAGLPAKSVDIVVTSPPYNLGIKYPGYKDNLTDAQYLDFIYRVGTALYRVMKPNASLFLNLGGTNIKPHMPFRALSLLAGNVFKLQNTIHWIKSVSIDQTTYGHFKPINSSRFMHSSHEFIFHLTKTGEVPLHRLSIGVAYQDKSNIARRNHKRDRRCRGNVWFIPYPTVQTKEAKFNHPTSFPIKLPRWCVRLHGRKNAVVLDPFLGTGTTMLAGNREGVKQTIGIEIDKSWGKIARQRLEANGVKVNYVVQRVSKVKSSKTVKIGKRR